MATQFKNQDASVQSKTFKHPCLLLSSTSAVAKFAKNSSTSTQRGHKILPSASLVPEDPTVLLTIAGMLPFKPIFWDSDRPNSNVQRLQKCIRTNDIENVGRRRAPTL